MTAQTQFPAIDIGPGYDRLAEAMRAEGLKEVRLYHALDTFTVKLLDGRSGQGRTIREAIETASHERLAA